MRLGLAAMLAMVGLAWQLAAAAAGAPPPVVYATAGYQSPVRGDPGDLLLLPGFGFAATDTVIYALVRDGAELSPPADVPQTSDAAGGIAPIVDASGAPHSLTVRLPATMQTGGCYALWVRTEVGRWSNGIKINDARPLWSSPAFAYASASLAGLPRSLKVVGRNLDSTATQVQLVGPQTFTLAAGSDSDDTTAIERYVAQVALPARMQPGTYAIRVRRDGHDWVALSGSTLRIYDDPAPATEFSIAAPAYGGCAASDGRDDTRCILAAIQAAKAAGGGVVTFGPGGWNLLDSATPGLVYGEGIVVPAGVDLRGAGAAATTLVRGDAWWDARAPAKTEATITLQGRNSVQGFTFKDEHVYFAGHPQVKFLKLGKRFDRLRATDPRSVDDVIVTGNVFERPYTAIGDGGLPIRRLFVTHNVFGAYHRGLAPAGYAGNARQRFAIEDSVIAYNTFQPGSYLDVAGVQGAIASEVGASLRVDFSDNVADGASSAYLNAPTDARGWRAAFFFHLNDNHEMLLVARNRATCTGDKAGDGEAIAFDDNHNSYAFDRAREIIGATASTITVSGSLLAAQQGIAVDPLEYYLGNWLYVAEGQGLGQTRRISAYAVDPASSSVTFTISPQWDVVPVAGDRATVGRLYWQVYTIDNFVDERQPLCLKSNRTAPKAGVITYWGRTSDSTIEGNRQYDTDGILLTHSYKVLDRTCAECTASIATQKTFLEVRGNTIQGEYAWDDDCSWSGIHLALAASRLASSPPPTLGYGVSIARNTIVHADGLHGGAISAARSWHAGPPPHNWRLSDATLIFDNAIADLPGFRPARSCGRFRNHAYPMRIGIDIDHAMAWRATLSGNTCRNVQTRLRDAGTHTVRLCPSSAAEASCECFGRPREP